jgi:hypothetical protein
LPAPTAEQCFAGAAKAGAAYALSGVHVLCPTSSFVFNIWLTAVATPTSSTSAAAAAAVRRIWVQQSSVLATAMDLGGGAVYAIHTFKVAQGCNRGQRSQYICVACEVVCATSFLLLPALTNA